MPPNEAGGADEVMNLSRTFPLPAGWSAPEPFCEHVVIERWEIDIAGLFSRGPDGGDAVGSAAARSESPLPRAYFELLERVCLLEAMRGSAGSFPALDARGRPAGTLARSDVFASAPAGASWCPARSNGVALGRSVEAACNAAELELIERDRVLRSWYGQTRPSMLALGEGTILCGLEPEYELLAYEFPAPDAGEPSAAGVFGFPRNGWAPLAYGFGAGSTLAAALQRAAGECAQRLAFLWGEAIPGAEPEPSSGPDYHQEYYLWPAAHGRLRAWLAGEHSSHAGAIAARSPVPPERRFAVLTPATGIGGLHVVKALASGELPLVFGRGHPWASPSLPAALAVHPIA